MNKIPLNNLKVLIVEDEKRLAQLLKDAIEDFCFKVALAKDGNEGIRKFHNFKPDIIISDIMMPNCDGLEMTERIKNINEDIPIIILSAHSHKEKLLKAIDLGVNKYFIKPFEPDQLIDYLEKLSLKINKQIKILLKDEFIFDNNTNCLYKNHKVISLTKREKEFLHLLLKEMNNLVLNKTIKETLWPDEEVSNERLRTFIKRLRLKTSKGLVENIQAQGYLISPLYS